MTQTARDQGLENIKGMAFVFISTVFFASMHALIKQVSNDMHPFEVAFFRNLFGVLVFIPVFLRHGIRPFHTKRPGLMVVRAAINSIAMLSFFLALALAPLADVAALNFMAPIFATMMAPFFLKEKVGWRRWTAILVGLGGAFLILRPGFGSMDIGHLLVVVSALSWAIVLIVIKIMSRTESALTITLYMVVLMTPISAVPAVFYWTWPDWQTLGWLAVIGMVGTLGQYLMAEGLRRGDTAVVMPLDFFKLVWATLLGIVVFGEVPDSFTYAGGFVIFLSATYIALRERALRKEPALPVARTPGQG